jgi:hypothetical protein
MVTTAPASAPVDAPTAIASSTPGGEPRTGGYWETWSTCGANSQAATAAANGGREAGWVITDDLLADPGIEVGRVRIESCVQGLPLLRFRAPDGSDRSSDPVFQLAGQLYVAELNVAAGARVCDALEGAVIAAQALLTEVGFDGSDTDTWTMTRAATAADVAGRLAEYNGGGLCQGS